MTLFGPRCRRETCVCVPRGGPGRAWKPWTDAREHLVSAGLCPRDRWGVVAGTGNANVSGREVCRKGRFQKKVSPCRLRPRRL